MGSQLLVVFVRARGILTQKWLRLATTHVHAVQVVLMTARLEV